MRYSKIILIIIMVIAVLCTAGCAPKEQTESFNM